MHRFHPARLFSFLLHDEVRLVEVFSALNLLAWAWAIYSQPLLLDRDSYQTFQNLSAGTWTLIFAVAGAVQIIGMIAWHRRAPELRFVAMALAVGCWATITANFMAGSISTTATANYELLTFVTAISGGFLGWKTSSSAS